jgi:hypothetical protein
MRRHLPVAVLGALAPVVLVTSVAWAYFGAGGSGTGSAPVASLGAPTAVTGIPTGSSVAVAWTAGSAPAGIAVGYLVTRSPTPSGTPTVVCGSPDAPLPAPADSCTDTAVDPGTYVYGVTAVSATFRAVSDPSAEVSVVARATTTTLDGSASSATFGAESGVVWTATVSSTGTDAASGTVSVASDATMLCRITLPATTCTSPATALDVSGSAHPVVATYAGDAGHAGSASDPRSLTVSPDTTTAAVTAAPSTVTIGYEGVAALGVTVATGNGESLPATEPVTVTVGTATCAAQVVPSAGGGTGSCHLGASDLAVSGTRYPVSTTYAGDADLAGSTATAATGLRIVTTPTVSTASLPVATQGQASYSKRLTVAGGTTPVTWSVTGGVLPAGLTLAPSTGTVHGAVDLQAATTTVTVTALDASGAGAVATFTLTVVPPPHITTTALAPAWAGEFGYAQALAATGGAPALSWSNTGVLPDGLTLDRASGTIAGSLTVAAVTETFTGMATDANGVTDAHTFTLAVTPTFVQQWTVASTGDATDTYAVVLANPVAAGDTLVLAVAQPCVDDSGPVDSPVAGVTWDGVPFTRAVVTGCADGSDAELWYLVGTGSVTGPAATTVTVDLAAPAVVPFLNVTEYAGVAGPDTAPSAVSSASGDGPTFTPADVVPSGGGGLVVSAAYVATPTTAALAPQLAPLALLNQADPLEGFALFGVDPGTDPAGRTYTQPAPGAWAVVSCTFTLAH